MFNDSTGFTMPVMPAAYGSGCGNNGMFGGDGWWAIIIILALFGGFGRGSFGGFGGGYGEAVATNGDIQRGFDTSNIVGKLDRLGDGICSLGYDQLSQMNTINQNVSQQGFNLSSAIAQLGYQNQNCCCETQRAIDGVNFNAAQNTCAITNAIHAEGEETRKLIQQNEIQALRDKVSDLQLAQSQCAQNAYLVNQLRPCPIPAYLTCSPYSNFGIYGNSYSNGCGCGNNF